MRNDNDIKNLRNFIELILISNSNKYKDTNLKYFRKQIQQTLDEFLTENKYKKRK
ncbi:MAG: hypothetical protein K9K32_04275 [Halanaerobiales bacterium]|nr:hypothetical protein [Halanaerobiales bacterium]